ncbi:6-phosphogluconolactonase [Synoicihabitans lomoniglobus]|uniref:6-phosphogluconolactonase n=1 Tax=Synoicihabitans lomoniglobus TaxID=2909285 RepID=A0AAF0CRG8_9BACT|nr:6-phosphogluconolactonase [Opitutaceae bacterium LMO-M01]WED66693.1 6-phosphogluconolactonase [Opitutaceae bacterium LMO-M01]
MTEKQTDYGRFVVGEKMELFAEAVKLAVAAKAASTSDQFTWAFTGGSTPQAWYTWAAETGAIPADVMATTHFTVSDERCVPLSSDENNFGNAERKLLAPLGVPVEHRHPWPVAMDPVPAAAAYRETMALINGPQKAYDVCFLGMGDDAHTASFFPGSALLEDDGGELFAAIDTPQKGWRLTITPTGLRTCQLIVVMALGAGKAAALKRVFQGDDSLLDAPSKILETCGDRVVWLVDEAAAAELS